MALVGGRGRQTRLGKLAKVSNFQSEDGAQIDGGFLSPVLCVGIVSFPKKEFLEISDSGSSSFILAVPRTPSDALITLPAFILPLSKA